MYNYVQHNNKRNNFIYMLTLLRTGPSAVRPGFGGATHSQAASMPAVTPNPKSVTKIDSSLPDNLSGPVLPYRMISFK